MPLPPGLRAAYYSQLGKKGAEARRVAAKANILASLTIIAGKIAERARQNVMSLRIPKDIANAITVGEPVIKGDGTFYIEVKVDMGDPTALGEARQGRSAARAFEYGSGIHSTKETPHKYPITPKAADALIFPFKFTGFVSSAKFIGGVVDDRYLPYGGVLRHIFEDGEVEVDPGFWNFVEHPGVEPQPYLKPAIESMKEEAKARLGAAFAASFIEESFEITVKV